MDTGSDICIVKQQFVTNTHEINENFKYKLNGIGEGTILTLGCLNSSIFISNLELLQNFHVVDDTFPIPCDGIIGVDFIKNNNCLLDYNLIGKSWMIVRPLFTTEEAYTEILDAPKPNTIAVPARSEVTRKISIDFSEPTFLIKTKEIAPGVFLANTISSSQNTYIKILNTTNKNVLLENIQIEPESLNLYHILTTDPVKSTPERKARILDKLNKNCPLQYKESLTNLCSDYTDIFAEEKDKVTSNNFYKQKLRLKDETPVYIKNYKLPHAHKAEIDKQVSKLLDDDIIEPSCSEYNSPILLVPKKSLPGSSDKRWRLVTDFRQVNKRLMDDKYPLPRIDDILDQLGKAKLFSCLDLMSGFHQVELDENSRDITSFSTSQGSFRYKRLPYGVKIAPSSFSRMMQIAFANLSPNKSFVYMDDLIVIGRSESHMIKNLKEVFEICRKTNLKLNPDKCIFFNPEVTFLGHKCTDKGILPDDTKYDKLINYPTPTNSDETRRFVAFVNYYRRFIPNFALHATHLTRLTRKNCQFSWTEECKEAFNYLKNSLLSPQILQYPDFNRQFCITTDASKIACGAVLSQDYNGTQLPIAFASRTFTKGESNKSVIEQELTAIHWAIEHFKPYVYGTKFLVRSDHKPLTYLFTKKNPSPKLLRIRLDLEEYDFEIEYIKGKDNCGADAFSRIDFDQIQKLRIDNAQINQVTTRSKSKSQTSNANTNTNKNNSPNKKSELIQNVYESISNVGLKKLPCLKYNEKERALNIVKGKKKLISLDISDLVVHEKLVSGCFFSRLENIVGSIGVKNLRISLNDLLFKYTSVNEFLTEGNKHLKNIHLAITPKLIIVHDKEEKIKLLNEFHSSPNLGGHAGTNRMLKKLRKFYGWRNMTSDVRAYVRNCELCKKNKPGKAFKEPLILTPTPEKAFDRIQIDTIGPLVRTVSGNEYAVTIMCELSKYLVAVPVHDKSAKTVAKAIVDHCILIYGPIKEILTDQGTEYKNQVFAEICHLLNIQHFTSTAYHHQTLGMVERNHRTFNEYLRSYLSPDKTDWDEFLKYFAFCYNTSPSSIHGYTPFELVYGKIAKPFEFLSSEKIDPIYNFESYEKELKFRLQEAHKRASKLIQHAKENSKKIYDKTSNSQLIRVHDMVYLKNEASHKLDSVFKGPYQVIELDDRGNCKIQIGSKTQIVHKNRLKLA